MQVFAKSDIGKERKINQDFYYIPEPENPIKLFILADGMGGYNGGEIASKMAVESVQKYIQENFSQNKSSTELLEQMLKNAVELANSVVYAKSQETPELQGMGTTLEVCLIYNNRVYIAHVGDSRVYRIRKDFMRKLTKDHSYVQTLIEDGTITKDEAFNHPKKNMLTKALGCTPKAEPDIFSKTFIKNDIILINSDGLTNMVREERILEIVKNHKEDIAEELVKEANDNGGCDNITVVVIM